MAPLKDDDILHNHTYIQSEFLIKHGNVCGCNDLDKRFVTKTWAYSEVFGFFKSIFWQKRCPPYPNQFLRIQLKFIYFIKQIYFTANAVIKINVFI